jgi:PAS domain S-box-containing protein
VSKTPENEPPDVQARIDSILNSVADIHILFDRSWCYLYVNEASVRAIGRTREEILGRTLWELYPDIIGTELERQYRYAMTDRVTVSFKFHYSRLDTWWENRFCPAPEGLAVFATEITERKRAEARLREYEKATEGLEEMIAVVDNTYRYKLANRAFLNYRGLQREQLLGRSISEVLGKTVFERIIKRKLDECFQGQVVKYEMKYNHANLGDRDLFVSYFPIEGPVGVERTACVLQDITERKRAQEELRRLSGQLLRSQDEERRRIARELHDSTGQDLVALATALSQLHVSIPSSSRKLRRLASQCELLAGQCIREVRTVSYLLHPPMLDEAGLEDATRHYAAGFTKRTGIAVELEISQRLGRMKPHVELALFRVLQESLTNIQRHSGSRRAKIRMDRDPGKITLEISDKGSGISGDLRKRNGNFSSGLGVGIPSMHERVKLLGGQLDIESSSNGTTVRVAIPADD